MAQWSSTSTLARPPPVTVRAWAMSISRATVKQLKPADTMVAGGAIDVDMNSLSDSLVKARLE